MKPTFLTLGLLTSVLSCSVLAETLTLNPVEDAYVTVSDPFGHHGRDLLLAVGRDDVGAKLALLKFDLTAIPMGSSINSAQLRLWLELGDTASETLTIENVGGLWSEGEVSWSTAPAPADVLPTDPQSAVDSAPGLKSWDVKSLVETWTAMPVWPRFHTLAVQRASGTSPFGRFFDSREGAHPPVLVVDYTPPPPDGRLVLKLYSAHARISHDDNVIPIIGGTQEDFYFQASVDGKPPQRNRALDGRDDAWWAHPLKIDQAVYKSQRFYPIHIELWDHDPDSRDDLFDINPIPEARKLDLLFDACSMTWQIVGRPESYGPTLGDPSSPEPLFVMMPRAEDLSLLSGDAGDGYGSQATIDVQVTTGDGLPFIPNDVMVAFASPIQAVSSPRYIVAGKPTVLEVGLSSSWTEGRDVQVNATVTDGTTTWTDTRAITVPPGLSRLILFNGSPGADPIIPARSGSVPYLTYSVTVTESGPSGGAPSPPYDAKCATDNNSVLGKTIKIIETYNPRVIYVPWDWDISGLPPTADSFFGTVGANETFRAAVFPIADNDFFADGTPVFTPFAPALGEIAGALPAFVLPWIEIEPWQTVLCLSVANAAVGQERVVYVPHEGWFADKSGVLDFTHTDTIGSSLAEFAPHAVLAEAGHPVVAAHELGHTYYQSQHSCMTCMTTAFEDVLSIENLINWGCRDEYKHEVCDGRPYLGFGYDVRGRVYPAGAGTDSFNPREINGVVNLMDSDTGSIDAGGVPTYGNWIDTFTFNDLCERMRRSNDPDLLVVSGLVYATNGIATNPPGVIGMLFPCAKTVGTPDLVAAPFGQVSGSGLILLRLSTAQGDRIYRFNPRFIATAEGHGDVAYFAFTVPWETNLTSVTLAAADNFAQPQQDIPLHTLVRSPNAPLITDLRAELDAPPNFASPLPEPPNPPVLRAGHNVVIAWQASDSDSPTLSATLYVAREPAANTAPVWLPYGLLLRTNQFTLPQAWLASAPGLYRVRVLVSDGINSTSFEVTNLFRILISEAEALVPRGAVWRYLDNGTDQGTAWRFNSFNDTGWPSGPALLGYGRGDEATLLSFGPQPTNKYVTTYFRKSFIATNVADICAVMRLKCDDGAAVYLNGAEVYRRYMPTGMNFVTPAINPVVPPEEKGFVETSIDHSLFLIGTNVLAVEVHQFDGASPDLAFDLELLDIHSSQTTLVLPVASGYSTIANPANHGANRLDDLLPSVADGTMIFKWNTQSQLYDTDYFDALSASWLNNFTLAPGEGAFVYSPAPQSFTFASPLPQPPDFGRMRPGPGLRLAGSRGEADSTFQEFMGFEPMIGDRVLFYDGVLSIVPNPQSNAPTRLYVFGSAGWTPSEPKFGPGQAAFVDLAAAPSSPVVYLQPQSQTVLAGAPVTFTTFGYGAAPLSYQWLRNGKAVAGWTMTGLPQFSAELNIPTTTMADDGNLFSLAISNSYGLTYSSNAVLRVNPFVPFTVSCAPNRTAPCGEPLTFDNPTASGGCSNVSIIVIGTVTNGRGCLWSATRTWQATDSCNHSATCSQTITVLDTTPPAIACAGDKVVECGSNWAFDSPTAFDTCSGTNVTIRVLNTVTNGGGCNLSITRTWQAIDACTNAANCTQTVTVRDSSPPVLNCVSNKYFECVSDLAFEQPTAFDACCGTNVTITVLNTITNRSGCALLATRTWEARDCCSNAVTCGQTVWIYDTIPPNITCPSNLVFSCPTNVTFSANASDNCNPNPPIGYSPPPGSFFFPGVTRVNCWASDALASDACTNFTVCSFTVTVLSNCPPPLCATNVIDFETIPGVAPAEGMSISNQFDAFFGVSFRRADGTFPLLAQRGSPVTGFVYPNNSSPPTGDDLNVLDNLYTRIGYYFLTLDGRTDDPASRLIMDFAVPMAQVSGAILDIDLNEQWFVRAYNQAGTLLEEQVLSSPDLVPGAIGGDGRSTPWQFNHGAADIMQVQFIQTNSNGGVGFDLFSFSRCPASNCLSLRCPTNIIAKACGSNCVPVYFKITATNYCNPTNLVVATQPPSGYCFPFGTTWVTATATGSGQTAECSFSVTILPNTNCAPGDCLGNLIVNGSFELPDVPNTPSHINPDVGAWLTVPVGGSGIPGWQVIGAPVSITRFPYNEGYETVWTDDGLQAADLTGEAVNGQGGLQQTVATAPGAQYVLRFKLGLFPGSYVYHGPVRVRVSANALTQEFVHDPSGSGPTWSAFELPFTADSSGLTTVRFENLDAQHWSGLDAVCLVPKQTNCLELHCWTNLVGYACESNCVPTYYSPSAQNLCNPNDVSVTVSPASGTCFPLGNHTVDVWAYGSGQTQHCSFTVTILPDANCSTNCLTPPGLTITPLPGCLLQVCWNNPCSNYVLQSCGSLMPPITWQPVDLPVITLAGRSCVLISNACHGASFYRLVRAGSPMLSDLGPTTAPAQLAALTAQLNLPATAYDPNGAVLFTDPRSFVHRSAEVLGDPDTRDEENVPLMAERFICELINQIEPVSDPIALHITGHSFGTESSMPTGEIRPDLNFIVLRRRE